MMTVNYDPTLLCLWMYVDDSGSRFNEYVLLP